MNVVIIGGAGVMGSFFAELFRIRNHRVVISDIDKKKCREVAERLEIEYSTSINDNTIRDADIVLLSTPIRETPNVIPSVVDYMKSGSLLMEMSSVKTPIKHALSHKSRNIHNIDIIGIHPMFCPSTKLDGQSIIIIPIKGNRWLPEIKKFFQSFGLNIHETTVERHDEIMSIIQVLIHTSFIGIASTIEELNVNINDLRPFMGKFHKTVFDFISRVTTQNHEMYASIQIENPNSSSVCNILSKNIVYLRDIIDRKDYDELIKKLKGIENVFPDRELSIIRSNKLIDLYTEDL